MSSYVSYLATHLRYNKARRGYLYIPVYDLKLVQLDQNIAFV